VSDKITDSTAKETKPAFEIHWLEDAVAAGAGLAVGLAARAPGEIGLIGKIAAGGIASLSIADAVVHKDTPMSTQAYARDGAFLTSLTAGLLAGPRLFGAGEATLSRKLSTTVAEDLTRQSDVLSGIGNFRTSGAKVVNIRDFMGATGKGTTRMIEEAEIGTFPSEKQREIRGAIEMMTKQGHEARHLVLSKDGAVMLDREAIDLENELKMLKGLGGK